MKNAVSIAGALLICALSAGPGYALAASPPAKARVAPEPQQREITYADLETQVGKRITVHTTLGTVRSGVLVRYTKTEFDMKLDEGIDLTVPANSIRSLSIPVPPPEPPTAGDSSAKKN